MLVDAASHGRGVDQQKGECFNASYALAERPGPSAASIPPTFEGIPTEAHSEVQRVSLAEAKAAYLDHLAVFVEVRSVGEYRLGHIPDSINVYCAAVEQHMDELNKQQWIITYCDCPHEEESASVASILLANGFRKVTPITGGMGAWKEAGLPFGP